MATSPDDHDLLPIFSFEKKLEEESLEELRALLRGLFVIRDQRGQDLGVDVTLEVVVGSRATNYIAMVQVKARSHLSSNQDGAVSLRVASSNLEYLLSATSSIIVLYDADRKTFYWCDVLDEVLALNAAGIDYRTQNSVTLRLAKPLTRENAAALHTHVLGRQRAARDLRLRIGSISSDGLVHVDAAGVGTTTNDVETDFLTRGWALASRGDIAEVSRLFALLSPSARERPQARLLMAHAHARTGQVVAAWAHLQAARRGLATLSADDRDLLLLIEIGVDHALGRAPIAELIAREEQIRLRATPELRAQLDISALRHAVTTAADPGRFEAFAAHVRELVTSLSAAYGALHPVTLSARVLESELAGHALTYRYAFLTMTCRFGDTPVGLRMRDGEGIHESLQRMFNALNTWMQANAESQQICAEWPLFVLELEKVAAMVQLAMLRSTRLAGIPDGREAVIDLDKPPGSDLTARLHALRQNAAAQHVDDVEVRARRMFVELLDLADRRDIELAEAQELAEFARACGFQAIEEEARGHEARRSSFREARRQTLTNDLSQEECAESAEGIRQQLRLPPERLPYILDDVECGVFQSRLGREHCRHLEILQDLRHEQSFTTLYARRPNRRCTCDARGIATMLPSPDWRAITAEFQRSYCAACDQRRPAQ